MSVSDLSIPVSGMKLIGQLTVPPRARGLVMFAHGSGSSRLSPRNQQVAKSLSAHGFATLLLDLLTESESRDRDRALNVELLATRLAATSLWSRKRPDISCLPIAYFGASTGAAAALVAAAKMPAVAAAVVCRGGRPDLVGSSVLHGVKAPTLLIVGGHDVSVLKFNRVAQHQLTCRNRLEIVPGAGHLFEEPGALQSVAELTRDWLIRHLAVIQLPASPAPAKTSRIEV
jgi:putative phosphoribosyl transferase